MVLIYVFLCNKWKYDIWVFFKNINKIGVLILFIYMYLFVSKMFFLYDFLLIKFFMCIVIYLFGCVNVSNF